MQYKKVLYYPGDKNWIESPFNYFQSINDSISSTEIMSKNLVRPISDSISNSEALITSKVKAASFNELISMTETILRYTTNAFVDIVSSIESVFPARLVFKTLSDSIANSEVVAVLKSRNVMVSDFISLTETIQRILNGNPITGWNKIIKPVNTIWKKIVKPF